MANLPWIPSVYTPNSTIAEMILRSGQDQANRQERMGQQIAGSVQDIGNVIGQGLQARKQQQNAAAAQGAISKGMAQPDAFESFLQGMPPEAQALARKGFADASDAASRVAERQQQIASGKARTAEAQRKLIQDNQDDMGTIAYRADKLIDQPEVNALGVVLSAQGVMKAHGVQGIEAFDAPIQQWHDLYAQAQQSGDPAAIKAADDKIRAEAKASFGHILMGMRPEHMKSLQGEDPKLIPHGADQSLYDPIAKKDVVVGTPKEKTPLQAMDTMTHKPVFVAPEVAAANPDRYQPMRTGVNINMPAAVSMAAVDAERPDPATGNKIDPTTGLTGNATYQNAATYALTGHMPSMGMGGKGVVTAARMAIQNKAGAIAAKAGVDLPTLQAEYRANAGTLAKLLPQAQATANFANTAKDNLDLALSQSPKVTRTDSAWVNSVVNAFVRGATPAAGLTKFETYIFTAAREYAKVTSGGAMSAQALSDTATKEATKLLNASQSPEAFQAATQAMRDDMDNVIKRQTEGLSNVSRTIANFFGAANNVPVGSPSAAPAGGKPALDPEVEKRLKALGL